MQTGGYPLSGSQNRLVRFRSRSPEIAFDCGFSDAAHFSRKFRTSLGVSPRQ
ncbi:helix-turn-helix domain-containing protein [Ancylobacter sp.]|uniref:helix-turn-helix domain-containing protein n=1 Tax=Ancylobacter sp. TaxID=1872567 RepID=UPI003BABD554